MTDHSDIDKKVGFWIRKAPYIWRRKKGGGGDPNNWKDWERVHIFHENITGNLLPKECPEDVRGYFNFISRSQFEYEYNVSPDWSFYESVIRIEGEDINYSNIPIILLFNYKGRKLLDHVIREVSLPHLQIPISEEEEPTVLSDYSKDWNIWFSIWYIDNIMGKDKRVCFPVNPDSWVIGLEIFDYPEGVFLNPPLKDVIRLCQQNKNFRFIYLPIHHIKPKPKRSHTLLLVIDLELNQVYYLDPVGVQSRLNQNILDKIMAHLDLDPKFWEFNELNQCPVGFQGLQVQGSDKDKRPGDPGGFCMVWILWIVETLIKNPDQHFKSILLQAHKQMKEETPSYTRFIRRYTKRVIDYQRNSHKKNREYIKHNLSEYVSFLRKHMN